jgi:hypothetical protein
MRAYEGTQLERSDGDSGGFSQQAVSFVLPLTSPKAHTHYKPLNFVGDEKGYEVTRDPVDVGHSQIIVPRVSASRSFLNFVQGNQTTNNCTHIHEGGKYLARQSKSCLIEYFQFSDNRRDKIRQWLSPTIPSTSYDEALERRLHETGIWFIGDKHFTEWKENADSLLWLYGKRMFARINTLANH